MAVGDGEWGPAGGSGSPGSRGDWGMAGWRLGPTGSASARAGAGHGCCSSRRGPGTERGSPSPAENCNPAWAPGMARDPNYLPLWRIPLSIFMLALCLPLSPRCYLCWPPLQDNAEFTILLCKQADVNLSCYVKKFILNQHSRKRRAWLLELEMYI